MAVDIIKNSPSVSKTNQQADANIEAGKAEGKKGAERVKEAGKSFIHSTTNFGRGVGTKLYNGGAYVGHTTVRGIENSKIQKPHALITPWKGIGIAAVLAGAGFAAPKFTTASYALTLTLPGVAFTVAGLFVAAAVYSWLVNCFTKTKAADLETAAKADSEVASTAEQIKFHEGEIQRLQKKMTEDAAKTKATKENLISETQAEIVATDDVASKAA